MTRNNCSAWIQCSVLIFTVSACSALCTTSFAFDRICMDLIPGAWFVAQFRLAVTVPGEQQLYTDWSSDITEGYKWCYSISSFSGCTKIIPQVQVAGGPLVNCNPPQYVVNKPIPGTYIYDSWGTAQKPLCLIEKGHDF